MTNQQTPPSAEPEKKEGVTPPPDTRAGLDQLRQGVSDKRNLSSQIGDLLRNFGNLSKQERMQQLGAIVSVATLGYIFGGKKEEAEKPAKKKRKKQAPATPATPAAADEQEEAADAIPEDTRAKRRKVVCDDMRLICINTDPAKSLVPKECNGNSNYLLEYGLPEFDAFKEEMVSILVPNASSPEAGVDKAADILKRCPMGKYQCMPQYLFQNVEKFKPLNLDWKSSGQGEQKLRAMWEFLQNEEMQKAATRIYLSQSARQYGGDPELVAASFYGGGRAADALKAYKAGTATAEQKELVEKKQGAYVSIRDYANTSKSAGTFDLEAELSRTGSRESGNLQGKKAKARDEAWERDQRFAYNRTGQTEKNNQTA